MKWIFITPVLMPLVLIAYFRITHLIRQSRQQNDFKRIFGDWKRSMPKLAFTRPSYGWPTFQVTFQKKEDFEFARRNKLIEEFKDRIKSYYSSKFDVEAAMLITYEGE